LDLVNGNYQEAEIVTVSPEDYAKLKVELLQTRHELESLRQGIYLTDTSTGLLNANGFEQSCTGRLLRANAHSTFCFMILRFDTTDSRVLLDASSHVDFIVEMANRMSLPDTIEATIGKLGSRHFAVLFPFNLQETEHLSSILDGFLAAASKPMLISGQTLRPVLRAGLSFWPRDGVTFNELQHHAEIALNEAIGNELRTPVVYHEDLKHRHSERLALVEALHQVVERGELRLFYQPQVDLENGNFSKAEALLRWDHLRLGILSPDQFIAVAEEEGLIVDITHWVMRQVVQDIHRLRASIHPDFVISINMAPSYLAEYVKKPEDFLDYILAQDLPRGSIVFEITEDTVLHPGVSTLRALESLKTHGFTIAIDDFGVGYSCLSYLQKLPIDMIKIDKQFVDPFAESDEGFELCKAVIHLSLDLGKTVVVEGLQTEHQVGLVRSTGAQLGQGYFFSPPLPLDDLLRVE
jgi:EAL domain-containing protein (putative c-di-GMP-specific phosphodiesterase class I)/GGDEF domain-containing protein